MTTFRNDIQALRGWAVGVVVLDHAGLEFFKAGFLGVDIFFVISGFLITGIVARSVADGRFTFADFYFKRARRILPAAFVTIALTAIGSIWFLTSIEMASLRDQTLGALTYTINFVLWNQVDYFAVDSNLKPLLHMWSLAVEEQFYLFLPMLLAFSPPRFWRPIAIVITLASLVFCLWWVRVDAAGAFYMLPSRAWELGIGALAALYSGTIHAKAGRALYWLYWPALVLLVAIPLAPFDFPHPGGLAALLCVATAVIILAANKRVGDSLPVRLVAKVGDISYSLYLVHWPVMVFAYSAYLGEPPAYLALVTIPLSILLAIAMFLLVEEPARKGFKAPSLQFAAGVPAATALVAGVYFASASYARPPVDFEALRAPNQGFSRSCDFSGRNRFEPDDNCSNVANPTIAVWGDSYAMHLIGGLSDYYPIIQATFSSCSPFLNIALKRKDMADPERWATRCMDFNNAVLDYVTSNETIKTVVLSTPWRASLDPRNIHWIRESNGTFVETKGSFDFSVDALDATVHKLSQAGKNVVLFGPPPLGSVDTAQCLERIITEKISFSGDCSIDKQRALRIDESVRKLLFEVSKRYEASVVLISDALCGQSKCVTQKDGIPIYRDHGHLSKKGSHLAMKMLHTKGSLSPLEENNN